MRSLKRDLVTIDCELDLARRRRQAHTDEVSRRGISTTIDTLLDERLELTSQKKRKQ